MEEGKTNLLEKTRDKLGRFVAGTKGNTAPNPTGKNGFTIAKQIEDALNNEAKRAGYKDFYVFAAHRALISDTVLVALLKKIVPDKVATEGEAIKFINFIYAYRNSNPNSPIRLNEQSAKPA